LFPACCIYLFIGNISYAVTFCREWRCIYYLLLRSTVYL